MRPGTLIPPVTASGGVGLLDFDHDGWLDVYLVQGGPFPPDAKSLLVRTWRSPVPQPCATARFEDVTDALRHRLDRTWIRARGRRG